MTDWKSLVRQHGQLVWRTVFRLVGNDADALDCFQETFLEAIKVDRKETVRVWPAMLRHLATVRALDLLRTRYRQHDRIDPLFDPDSTVDKHPDPGQLAEAGELAEQLRKALTELPDQQAELFCLCRLDELSYQEAAARLGLEINTVGVLLHRARKRLKELLALKDSESGVIKRGTKT